MTLRSRPSPATGFTLIEVLIALSLSVILAAMLFSSLHTYALGTAAGQTHLAAKQTSASVYQFIGDQLRGSVPLTLRLEGERRLLFLGNDRRVVYIGHIPRHRSAGGLHKNSLVIEGQAPHQSLVFSYERLVVDEAFGIAAFTEPGTGISKTLIADARAIEFEYFGPQNENEDSAWSTEWSRNDLLPALVRVRVSRSNKQTLDDMVIPIYANTASKRAALTIGTQRSSKQNDVLRLLRPKDQQGLEAIPATENRQ